MNRGFTLVELLVALFITAILFAMGYGAVDQAITGRKQVETQAARLLAVQTTMRIMEQDIGLLQPRPVRNPIGDDYQAALVSGSDSGASAGSSNLSQQGAALLALTRTGWSNPAGVSRSELQRVSYLLEEGKLVRYHLPVLDAAGATATIRRELLDQVEAVSFRYMDAGHRWRDDWPPGATAGTSQRILLRTRPVAVEITLTLKDWGTMTRIVEVAG